MKNEKIFLSRFYYGFQGTDYSRITFAIKAEWVDFSINDLSSRLKIGKASIYSFLLRKRS